jgi:hypothetical protein
MKKIELDELWKLYREFCERANQANMVMNVPEFLSFLNKFKVEDKDL